MRRASTDVGSGVQHGGLTKWSTTAGKRTVGKLSIVIPSAIQSTNPPALQLRTELGEVRSRVQAPAMGAGRKLCAVCRAGCIRSGWHRAG